VGARTNLDIVLDDSQPPIHSIPEVFDRMTLMGATRPTEEIRYVTGIHSRYYLVDDSPDVLFAGTLELCLTNAEGTRPCVRVIPTVWLPGTPHPRVFRVTIAEGGIVFDWKIDPTRGQPFLGVNPDTTPQPPPGFWQTVAWQIL
jgi:hypothetical protein